MRKNDIESQKLNTFKIIAFTHKTIGVDSIGKLHIAEDQWENKLTELKAQNSIGELMMLSTCNRVEFLIVNHTKIDTNFLTSFFTNYNHNWTSNDIQWAVNNAMVFEGDEALEHLFSVASSIDSLVVGEREIITQVRNSYEKCNQLKLTGDLIRLIIKRTIETAKQVYTETSVAKNPVSVVSLAYRKLKELNVKLDARFIIIGSGITNSTMAKYLKKHGFTNFTVFNRTLMNAQKLAKELNAEAFALSELIHYKKGFDVILTCTGATEAVITKNIYTHLVSNDISRKVVIDLAVPNDLDAEVANSFDINLIAINNLQEIAKDNLAQREEELENCKNIIKQNIEAFEQILKIRKVELAMSAIPNKVKEIKHTAINEVFAKELEGMDERSKEVLEKIICYMEKKYISVPMKMAKEILLEERK